MSRKKHGRPLLAQKSTPEEKSGKPAPAVAPDEIENVKTTSNLPAWIVTAVALCCGGSLIFIGHHSIEKTKAAVQDALDHFESRTAAERKQFDGIIRAELLAKAKMLDARGQTLANDLEFKINARIDREVASEKVHSLIGTKASQRVDQLSAALIDQRVNEVAAPLVKDFAEKTVGPKTKEIEARLATISNGVAGSENRLRELQATVNTLGEQIRIITLIMRVEGDDYPAYVELKRQTASPDKTVAQLTRNAVEAVDARFRDRGSYESLTINDEVGEPEYGKIVAAITNKNPIYRRAAMDMLAERKEKRAIDPIMNQLENETDLKVIRAGIRAMMQITGDSSEALDLGYWVSWRSKNKPLVAPLKNAASP